MLWKWRASRMRFRVLGKERPCPLPSPPSAPSTRHSRPGSGSWWKQAPRGFDVSILGLGTSRLASMGSGRSKRDAEALLGAAGLPGPISSTPPSTMVSLQPSGGSASSTASDPDRWVVATPKTGLPTVDLPGPFRVANQPLKKARQLRGQTFALETKQRRRTIDRSLRRLRRERIGSFSSISRLRASSTTMRSAASSRMPGARG